MTIRKSIAAGLRAFPNPFRWLADKIDPPKPDVQPAALGGTGPYRPGD